MKILRYLRPVFFILLFMIGVPALADNVDLAAIQANLQDTETHSLGVINAVALTGGIVFFMSSVFKFHQWRQNPQQISVGQPFFLMMIGVVMISLPLMMGSISRALYGEGGRVVQLGDSQLANIVVPDSME